MSDDGFDSSFLEWVLQDWQRSSVASSYNSFSKMIELNVFNLSVLSVFVWIEMLFLLVLWVEAFNWLNFNVVSIFIVSFLLTSYNCL